jgi:hypothetical protein
MEEGTGNLIKKSGIVNLIKKVRHCEFRKTSPGNKKYNSSESVGEIEGIG